MKQLKKTFKMSHLYFGAKTVCKNVCKNAY